MNQWIKRSLIGIGIVGFLLFLYIFNQSNPVLSIINKKNVFYEKAKVVEILEENLNDSDDVGFRVGTQKIKAEVMSGKEKGHTYEAVNYISYSGGVESKIGQTIILNLSQNEDHIVASVYTGYRAPVLYIAIFLFIALICLIAGKQGIRSVLALGFTLVCILFLFIPMIFRGYSPILSAILIVVLTTVITMLLIAGKSCKSLCAILGTIAGVVIAGVAAQLIGYAAGINGFQMAEADDLVVIAQQSGLQVKDLLFAGILIASLGAVMDVAMSISSTLQELYDKKPSLTSKDLWRSGMTVGKDMMGTMSNTLILAFTGSSIPTMIFIFAYQTSYYQYSNTYSIAIEIMQGIAGSLGVILCVPMVSLIAAILIPKFAQTKRHQQS